MYLLTRNYRNIFNQDLRYLFSLLIKKGDEARLVGGCVRNYLLNIEIDDYDIATIYTPEEVETILKNNNIDYLTIGKEFGTIVALIKGKKYEITTLRKDIKTDGRHAVVEYTKSYEEDAQRRDFTFNALYIDYNGKIYDYCEGIQDLLDNNIRFIGNSEERIKEDYLRILRFFRFYGTYCFSYNKEDFFNCIKYKNQIRNLSIERLSSEFIKIFSSKYCIKILKLMQNAGILQDVFGKNLDFKNLEIFYSIKDFLKFEYNYLFIIALVLSQNNVNYNLMLIKKDKSFLDIIIKNLPKEITKFELKRLLFLLKNKFLVKNIIILYHCNNYTKFKYILKDLKLLDKLDIPELDLSGKDLIEYNFENKNDYSKILERSKEIFIENNFKIKKRKIIKKLKKEFHIK